MGIIFNTEVSCRSAVDLRLVVFLIAYVRRTSIKTYQYLVDCEKTNAR